MATRNPCATSFEIFTDEFLASYNASYTFCRDAAEKCVDNPHGAQNVSSVMVTDARQTRNATGRPLYFFYAKSPLASNDDQVVLCLKENGLENATMFWAPGLREREQGDMRSNGALGSRQSRHRSGRNLSFTPLLSIIIALLFLFQHMCGVTHASILPGWQKRAVSCAKFETQDEAAFFTSLQSHKISSTEDCRGQVRCILFSKEPSVSFGGELSYDLNERTDLPIQFDDEQLIKNSFNSSLIERYSIQNRQRPSTPMVSIQGVGVGVGYIGADKSADLYRGTFTDCQDGKQYPGRLSVPTATWQYNLVTTTA